MIAEEWRPVVGYEGRYEVSDHGHVRSIARTLIDRRGRRQRIPARVLTPVVTRERRFVSLYLDGKGKRATIATLMLKAFVGPRPPGYFACHGDDDPGNDTLSNLRWDTPAGNTADAIRNQTGHPGEAVADPAGHRYDPPNIKWDADKRCRGCRACSTARTWAWHQRQRGLTVTIAEQNAYANRAYEQIMTGKRHVKPRRQVCLRGHLCQPPNLLTQDRCRACNTARCWARDQQRRKGITVTKEATAAYADHKYTEIMATNTESAA